ncbi:MAG TPA: sigma-70 family RNA polymerase sigma factor [Verrucomicrobiales bacterium]|nr:sigma-70 family RNA polymerase sigma factor [Verrucomicrobiales bacterium]
MPDPRTAPDAAFTTLLDTHQQRLLAWLIALTGDASEAKDVLQQTNLVLWKKAGDFAAGTSFSAWAFRVAKFEFLSWRQRKGRERLIFNDELLDGVAAAMDEADAAAEARHAALDACLPKLPARQREVVVRRYLHGERVDDIGAALDLPANAVSQILWRARQNLLECINRTTAVPAHQPL